MRSSRPELTYDPGLIDLYFHAEPLAVECQCARRPGPAAAHGGSIAQRGVGGEAKELKVGIHGLPGKRSLGRTNNALVNRQFL